MKLKLRGATVWLPLLVCVLGLSACGGSSGGKSNPPPPPPSAPPPDAGGPPPPPPPPAATAPSGLSYTSAASYTTGTDITPLDPTVTGTVTSYVVSPGFPAGITLDATTGKISGTPTAPAPATTYTVTASNATGSTTFDMNFSVLNERVTADRPDEKTDLHQVHVIYALPSDAVDDEQLDQKGTIEESLRILNDWFELKVGKELRFDTYGGGRLDVTFMKLTQTDLQMQGLPRSSVRKELDEQLYLHGFDDVKKAYLVYYGGDGENCGRGAYPPTLQGNVAALYIGAASGCRNVPFAAGNEPPNFLEFLALHEVLHVLGFVPECAPNYAPTGHVDDSRQDVMFSSDATGTVLGGPPWELDVNLDDYYHRGAIPGCLDLANSAFLDPLPAAAEPPPTWPYPELTDLGCQVQHTPPATLGAATGIMFVNRYEVAGAPAEARLYEVVPDADVPGQFERIHLEDIPHGDGVIIPRIREGQLQVVREGAVYVVLVNGNCRHTVRAGATPGRFTIQASTAP